MKYIYLLLFSFCICIILTERSFIFSISRVDSNVKNNEADENDLYSKLKRPKNEKMVV